MSLFGVRVNDSPVAVTDTGFGMMLFFARSVGSGELPVQPLRRIDAIAAINVHCIFIGSRFVSVSGLYLIGFKYMFFESLNHKVLVILWPETWYVIPAGGNLILFVNLSLLL
jgi:hypothetical protein